MIDAFSCDFALAKDIKCTAVSILSELDEMIRKGDKELLKDIGLLEELAFLLRSGQAEIHLLKNKEDI